MEFIKIEDVFDFGEYEYYAHYKEEDNNKAKKKVIKETLEEHTLLSEYFFEKIIKEKELLFIFERIRKSLFLSDEFKDFYFILLNNVITFHDFGKINPDFQKRKMNNDNTLFFNSKGVQSTAHSLLSSAFYISEMLKRLNINKLNSGTNRKEAFFCLEIMFNFAFLISRHHSNLGNFIEFIQSENLSEIMLDLKNISIENGGILKECTKYNFQQIKKFYSSKKEQIFSSLTEKELFSIFLLNRLMFSILVASDYYATSQFMKNLKIDHFNKNENIFEFQKEYEKNFLIKNIRSKKQEYLFKKNPSDFKGINDYRNKLFLETEVILQENIDKDIFFLEAPTGSGKSNTAVNLSFQLLNTGRKKIIYVYPFNTLVEQNKKTLEKLFEKNKELLKQIKVINSITPMVDKKEDEYIDYDKILLDRQFLHYPFIVTTHIGIFDILVGASKGNIMPLYQIANSVIVLDEIQAYRSEIWTEIMMLLEEYATFLNIKIIMMSATLPDLSILTQNNDVVRLVQNRDLYFQAPIFKDRVTINYELLDKEISIETILEHIMENSLSGNKILVEFISKKEAKEFYHLCEQNKIMLNREVLLLTGEDNRARRKQVIDKINQKNNKVLLVATQLIEAGVDIDMDIGYKDISGIDNEEQFLGRINRSCKKNGIAYFFNLKDAKKIYQKSIPITNSLNVLDLIMRKCLETKNFSPYYQTTFQCIQNKNLNSGDIGIQQFKEFLWNKDFTNIQERIKLIEANYRKNNYFFNREIEIEGEILNGKEIWEKYREVLHEKDYAKQQVLLSEVREKMSYFIYEVSPKQKLLYNDYIGELFYIEDGEKYFNKEDVLCIEDQDLFI